ncbi:MAG: sigma 54-interacting transcriptional regulator [Desulfuromonadales bacterium]|nr:sigma 54-interacting transcriptional regulator [Desulfuromonadales bacterium]MBN2791384.1 sigma 54-interacting transcriptional regulator [Desulfuromonadales bacterium]
MPKNPGTSTETFSPHEIGDFNTLLDCFSQGFVSTDLDGTIQIVNQTAREWFDCYPGASIEELSPEIRRLFSTFINSGANTIEFPLRKNHHSYTLQIRLLKHDRQPTGAACIIEKQSATTNGNTGNQTNLALETLINSTSDGLCICDPQGLIQRMNRTSARFYGAPPEQMIGRSVTNLVEQGLIDRSAAWEVIKSGKISNLLQQRGPRKLLVTGTPIHDESGKLLWVVVSERDITEIDSLRRDLEEQKALNDEFQLQVLNLQKMAFAGRQLIARTPCMIKLIEQALKVSKTNSSILLFGESGVGKGVIADLIHKNSMRANRPIIKLNCGAIPESLIESELFGYEKGAFTGATGSKPGYFEMADGGLLFLDEIAELPASAQVKLLRFLEDGQLTRLGGTKAKNIDVRIIAATHRNLDEMVQQGKFRHDLYYRLNVIPLHVPPVRDRKDCILPMIRYYLDHFCEQTKTRKHLTQAATETLTNYDYPGNVRELMNLCERLVVMTETESIDLPDLPVHVVRQTRKKSGGFNEEWPEQMSLRQIVQSVERGVLMHGLEIHRNQARLAEALKVNQSTITRKLRRHGLQNGNVLAVTQEHP